MKLFNQQIQWKPSSDSLSEDIQKKLLYHLYENTQKTLIPLLVLNIIVFAFLKDSVPAYLIYSWASLLIFITFSRLYDGYRYMHHDHSQFYREWHAKLTYKAYSTALLWGSIIFFIPYIQNFYLSLMAHLFIMGIGSGAASSFSPSKRIIMFYLIILFSPMFFHFLFLGTAVGFVLATSIILYYITLHKLSKNIRHSLIVAYEQEEKDKQIQSVLHEELDKLSSLFKNAPIGVFYFDLDLKLIDYNEAFTKLYDTDISRLTTGLDLRQLPDKRPLASMEKTLTEGVQYYSGPYTTIKGREVWIDAKASPIINSKGDVLGGIVLVENKTAEKKAIDELNYMARYDALTSLANRRNFMEYMHQLIKKEEHSNRYSILLYLDLNQFKTINDTMGHSVGDQLLIQVANRLKMLTKKEYNLSRLGGDEFVIVLPLIADNEEDAYKEAEKYSYELKEAFTSAFLIEEMHLYIKCSIGIVIIEPGSHNIEEIIRYADISMYEAKRKGGDTIAYYNKQLDTERKELFGLQYDLHHAIVNQQFKVYYQPIVTIDDESLKAAEALVRWDHPTLGILTSEEFVPLATESGLIDEIGWIVIDMVCSQIAEWKKESFLLDYISINIDAKQLQKRHFVEKFFGLLDHYNIQTNEIKLEITENSLIENYKQTQEIIQTLTERGIRCAIDDFGTGYSSLSYLKKFSFSVLKIDREFIKDILDKPENVFLVESIISIGKKLGYHIVVEGIETKEQKDLLKNIDSTLQYQGYYFSPPLTPEMFKEKFSH